MKKSILALLVMASLNASAQIQLVKRDTTLEKSGLANEWPQPELTEATEYGKWVKEDAGYIAKYTKLSPVAIKEAVTEVKTLLELINVSYYLPAGNQSLYYSDETEEEYAKFYVNASIDFSTVKKAWSGYYHNKKYNVMMVINKDIVSIAYERIK